jgi:hypothetical protein
MCRSGRRWAAVLLIAALSLLAVPANAHDTKPDGAFLLTIGWGSEPPYSGLANSIEVVVTDTAGAPVDFPGDALRVEVLFGSERLPLALLPNGQPGTATAVIVPTRAGSYTFHILGTISGQPIDTTVTCSNGGLECVSDLAEVAVPGNDPAVGQLADRLDRELPRLENARSDASDARRLALIAISLGGLAVVVAFGLGVRRGRKSI